MTAPWAYEDEPIEAPASPQPTWSCPGGQCACHGAPTTEAHRIHLFDRLGHLMPGARCRILVARREINRAPPYADARGAVTFKPRGAISGVVVEWAPANMPQAPEYPYRARYMTTGSRGPDAHREQTRRRLGNLGFDRFARLADNVADFQEAVGRPVTSKWQHVAHELAVAHDAGVMQPFVAPPLDHHHAGPASAPPPAEAIAASQSRKNIDGDSPVDGAPPSGKGDGNDPTPVPPPVNPAAGSVCRPGLGSLRFELRIATPLRPFKGEFLNRVAGARIVLDGSALIPPVPKQTHVVGEDGTICIGLPKSAGTLLIDILPPLQWVNDQEVAAGPALTDVKRPAGEAELAKLPDRDKLFSDRRSSEARLLLREAELTVAGLALEKAQTTGNQAAIAAATSALTAANNAVAAEFKVREVARAAINARAHEANVAYARAMPEFMFRSLRFLVALDNQGRLRNRLRRFSFVDPEIETPLAQVHERSGSFDIDWFPDWMRAPAHRFSWQQAVKRSAFVDPAQGLGGKACVLLHNTGSGEHSLSTVLTGLTRNDVTANNTSSANADLSVHYLISRKGHVIKMVDEHYTAFHGSPGIWQRDRFIDFRAVGIELLNSGTQDFTDPQMRALRRLLERLTQRFGVARRHVLGHGEINHAASHLKLNKKNEVSGAELHPRDRLLSCPGRRFPWASFSDVDPKLTFDRVPGLQSSSKGKEASAAEIRQLKHKLGELGYPVSADNRALAELDGEFDAAAQRAYAVFQLRWHTSRADRPARVNTQAPNKATVKAVIAAIDAILNAPP